MDEYIIIQAPMKDWQKWLNQWKHEYKIDIISAQFLPMIGGTEIAICLRRLRIKS
jgi:hypothetical protein